MAEEYVNKTGTDLEVLQKIEQAWKRNNPSAQKRNNEKSLNWFRNYVGKSFNKIGTGVMFRDRSLWGSAPQMGKLQFFEYDALHKEDLPVWDRYPLIFPFAAYTSKEGKAIFLGLNMHYLPPALRMVAFKALLKLRSEKRYRKNTRLEMEWSTLKAMSESKYFAHAVHAYRMDHVKSVFVEIPSVSWELALFLPLARFQKGGKAVAWDIK
jgi:hypothetical protein